MSSLFPPATEPEEEVFEGTVRRVVYSSEETSWSVIRLRPSDSREAFTAVGRLLGVQPGERLRVRGRWKEDRKYGRQFEVTGYVPMLPETADGIRRYLGSGLVPGIGPSLAERLVQSFGEETLEILEHHPERLVEVEGIGPVRSERIRNAWQRQRSLHEVMVFLQGHGISTGQAVKIWRRFGDRAVSAVRQDPYALAQEVAGIGFRSADAIAISLGWAPDAAPRIAAGVLHSLKQAGDRGHLYLPRGRLVEDAAGLLEVPPAAVEAVLGTLGTSGHTVEEELPDRSLVVYSRPLHEAETRVAARLRELLATRGSAPGPDAQGALSRFEKGEDIVLAAAQREAVISSLTRPLTVLTGGPGTGKTTLVRGLVHLALDRGERVALAAPTGRAAQRLAETTGAPARTVHRLLELNPRTMCFQRHAGHPLDADLVVIDEASMLDLLLFRDLLEALPRGVRLVLVGDADQLPSVGPGRVLGDLIDSSRVAVVRLSEIYRQSRASRIVTNAHRIREGRLPELEADASSDFFFVAREDPDHALATLEELVTRRIPRGFGLDPVDDIQVLTPMRRGVLGTRHLNQLLQERLNPSGAELRRGQTTFRLGDKVMQLRNHYGLEVFNGDIGRIATVDGDELALEVDFGERRVRYETEDLDDLGLSYACSVHKAQGSEYPAVVVLLHTQHYVMLERSLLYTAVTRGRRLVVLLGNQRALAVAVRNYRREQRLTRLAERLAGEIG